MATNRMITRQEQLLAQQQRQLEQLDRVRAQMVKAIEQEMKALERMKREAESIVNYMGGTTPPLSQQGQEQFDSQYEQYSDTRRVNLGTAEEPPAIKLAWNRSPRPNEPTPGTQAQTDLSQQSRVPNDPLSPQTFSGEPYISDRRVNWNELTTRTRSPEKTYVSGTYVRTMNGSPILDRRGKQYEYEITAGALPLSVGEEIVAPVHPGGHRAGMLGKKQNLIFRVNSIYEGRKYFGEHDRIEEKVSG